MGVDICYENITRKVDALGRISVPSGLRSRFGINTGEELEFGTIVDNDTEYIVMCKKNAGEKARYQAAANLLKELGCNVPKELEDKL